MLVVGCDSAICLDTPPMMLPSSIKFFASLIGDGVVKRVLFGGSFLFGLEVRKFMADRDSVETGVDEGDIDFDKMTFISIGDTGEVLHGKILASRGANADEPENYDFSLVTRSSGKGPNSQSFLEWSSTTTSCVIISKRMSKNFSRLLALVCLVFVKKMSRQCSMDSQKMSRTLVATVQ